MDATIVIPVKNGGKRLFEVLEAISNQKTKYQYETVIVDSGSTDGSIALAKGYNVKLIEIDPKDFGHGKTRNLGAAQGSGKYIIFLTQDALPATENWLEQLVDAMEKSNAAGGFGRHLPYPECNMVDQKLLYFHFIRFGEDEEKYYSFTLDDSNREKYETDSDYEQYLTFFSDNCSILRRETWEKIPYEDVDFAEDQVWAKTILEAGYTKIYIPGAKVYHSHDYPLREYGKRYFDDFKAVYRVHGYNMCPDKGTFFKLWIKNSLSDSKFALKQKISIFKKIYWCFYALNRNYIRNKASVSAVKYFALDDAGKAKMDRKYSQQLKQRG